MDTSKEYIKMCDCPEIQGTFDEPLHPAEFGYNFYSKDITVWLPRQDQIQEMIGYDQPILLDEFYKFTQKKHPSFANYAVSMGSMEQLWLAFYMWENHQKIWDSKKEKWVKSVKE